MKDIVFEVARRHSYTMPSRETHIDIEIYYLSQGDGCILWKTRPIISPKAP